MRELAEHLVEDVGESRREAAPEPGVGVGAGGALLEGGVAETVVGGPLLVVAEGLVGLGYILEFLFRRGVPGIVVRVVLHGQLAVGLLDRLAAGLPVDPEEGVKILFSHGYLPARREPSVVFLFGVHFFEVGVDHLTFRRRGIPLRRGVPLHPVGRRFFLAGLVHGLAQFH